jgi:hypothetical protein
MLPGLMLVIVRCGMVRLGYYQILILRRLLLVVVLVAGTVTQAYSRLVAVVVRVGNS